MGAAAGAAAMAATGPETGAASALRRKAFDLVVVGATPGGVACAVRASREGLNVLLVNHNEHLGGMLSNGLRVWDTLYEGKRSGVYDELRANIFRYYRETYGEKSPQYRAALPGKSGHNNGNFEPHVAEKLITEIVAREKRITVLPGYYPVKATGEGPLIRSVTFKETDGAKTRRIEAKVFADCTYEGDLAAAAKAQYRIGRESRKEFAEPHAGKIYMRRASNNKLDPRTAAVRKRLNIRKFGGMQEIVMPESTGKGDVAVQAFNMRTIVTNDPRNRLPIKKPDNYDSRFLATLEASDAAPIPNRKFGLNRPQLVGPHNEYVEGDRATRRRIIELHKQATLAQLYYLQHEKGRWREFGLPKDEFTDNDHMPYEIYVREARRIVGRYVMTEHDLVPADDYDRAPIHADSIAVTEWYMDTHACRTDRAKGSLHEGKMMLHLETMPAQVPYRCLLPKGVDNLLVPVCLSSTHVAWGAIRLEPTWMNVAESAGYAAAQAVKKGKTPAKIDVERLLRTLADNRVMISFFNDVDTGGKQPWVAAVQWAGTKGFFASYDAYPAKPLTSTVALKWAETFGKLVAGRIDPQAGASALKQISDNDTTTVTTGQFASLLEKKLRNAGHDSTTLRDAIRKLGMKTDAVINRGNACLIIYSAQKK